MTDPIHTSTNTNTNTHADLVAPRTGAPPGQGESTSPGMAAGPFLLYGLNLTETAPRTSTGGGTPPRWLPPSPGRSRPRPKPASRTRPTRGR